MPQQHTPLPLTSADDGEVGSEEQTEEGKGARERAAADDSDPLITEVRSPALFACM